jgi:hypothetical protein
MPRDGAEPEVIAPHVPKLVVGVEIDRRIDDGPLAIAPGQRGEEGAHHLAHFLGLRPEAAGLRLVRPFDIEDRRQGRGIDRHMLHEPARLFLGRATEVVIVIGAARHSRRPGQYPVGREHFIGHVAALGRLDIGEGDVRPPHEGPVDVALIARDIDPMHRVVPGRPSHPVMRMTVAEDRDAGRGARHLGRGRIAPATGREHAKNEKRKELPRLPLPHVRIALWLFPETVLLRRRSVSGGITINLADFRRAFAMGPRVPVD